jgi:hypothetical protein
MSDLRELSTEGRVVQPGDEDWDDTRAAWNLIADQRPTAVALMHGATTAMRSVEIDASARTARLEAGVLSGELGALIRGNHLLGVGA